MALQDLGRAPPDDREELLLVALRVEPGRLSARIDVGHRLLARGAGYSIAGRGRRRRWTPEPFGR
jgi:hypothetical protein